MARYRPGDILWSATGPVAMPLECGSLLPPSTRELAPVVMGTVRNGLRGDASKLAERKRKQAYALQGVTCMV